MTPNPRGQRDITGRDNTAHEVNTGWQRAYRAEKARESRQQAERAEWRGMNPHKEGPR